MELMEDEIQRQGKKEWGSCQDCYLCEEAVRGFAVLFQNLWRRWVAVLKLRVIPEVWLEELSLLTFHVGWFNGSENALLPHGVLSISTAGLSQLREFDSKLRSSIQLAMRTKRQADRTANDGYIAPWPRTMEELQLADFSVVLISWSDQNDRPHVLVWRCGDDALCSFKLSVGGVHEPHPFFLLVFLGED